MIDLLGGVRATVFAGLALLLLVLAGVQSWRLDSAQDTNKAAKAQAQADLLAATEAARKREGDWAAAVYDITFDLVSKGLARERETAAAVADLRRGALVVRPRLTCRVPDAAQAVAGVHGAEAGGLSVEDAEFLLRVGADADGVADQLAACQAYARAVSE
ncbi:hypothetical protein [Lysobacter sp. Root667]|uniref:hypothetical protein n=1 Tax=Lysobacter sp. Root667 TaxID=1736581 RepID=UPI0012DC930C|nr:hypothetical protein [Lysobacter sp. Root667]